MNPAKNKPFLQRLRFACDGFVHAVTVERSLRFHVGAVPAVLVIMVLLHPEPAWWAIVAVACGAVMAAELFNTAIEALADHLHPNQHPSIRIVKDCAAGAVLITSIAALAVAASLLMHLYLTRN